MVPSRLLQVWDEALLEARAVPGMSSWVTVDESRPLKAHEVACLGDVLLARSQTIMVSG